MDYQAEIEANREKLQALSTTVEELIITAKNEKRELTEEEASKSDECLAECERIEKDCERLQRLIEQKGRLESSAGRKTEPEANLSAETSEGDRQERRQKLGVGGSHVRVVEKYKTGNGGFESLGQFAVDVRQARSGNWSERLSGYTRMLAATTYGAEGTGQDGGFAVPPDFSNTIVTRLAAEDSLLALTDQQVSMSNNFVVPVDETTAWESSNGIYASWEGEADTFAQRKPQLQQRSLRLHKLGVLVPLSEELLEDAAAMDSYLRRKAPEQMVFKINLALVQGTGVGQPLGLLNSPCAVSVAKQSSQDADSVVANNIIKMWSRMYAPYRSSAVWLINQDIEPELYNLALPGRDDTGTAVTGWGSHVYLPANAMSSSPFATLMGRPVIPTQACETLGDKGDIFFWAPQQYLTVQKVGGIRTDTSIHLYFDQDVTAFRFVIRVAGAPWLSTTISARDGSTTYSSVVTLDERG